MVTFKKLFIIENKFQFPFCFQKHCRNKMHVCSNSLLTRPHRHDSTRSLVLLTILTTILLLIFSLVDYIGGDYKNAVRDGSTTSEEEYAEMLDFSSEALNLFRDLKSSDGDKAGIESNLVELRRKIENKSSVDEVESISKEIKDRLISAYGIITYPKSHPSFQVGKDLYERNCAQCHGVLGAGNGPLASNLTPPPTNFTDGGSAGGLSPFKVYNTMSFGIEGTAMPSFPKLSEDEKWNIAFYVPSLSFDQNASEEGKKILRATGVPGDINNLKDLATLSNQ